ncbi:unnamed protein product, partial [Didymodactylos carnosus]
MEGNLFPLTSSKLPFLTCSQLDLDEVPLATRQHFVDNEEVEEELQEREVEEMEERVLTSNHLTLNYNDLVRGEFQGRPIMRKAAEHNSNDPTIFLRQKLFRLCQALTTSIDKRFQVVFSLFETMGSCLDVGTLHQEVVVEQKEDVLLYGRSSLQALLDYTKNNSTTILLDHDVLHSQYVEWKQRCLLALTEKETRSVWTKDEKIESTKVMQSFFTNTDLASGIEQFLHFYALMVVKIRSEAVC